MDTSVNTIEAISDSSQISGLSSLLLEAGVRYGHGFYEDVSFIALGVLLNALFGLLLTAFFMMADKEAWLEKYRIQPGKSVDPELEKRAVKTFLIRVFVMHPVTSFILAIPIYRFRNMHLFTELPNFSTALLHFIALMIINDTLSYWIHRAFHENQTLYKLLHKQHHEFKTCSSVAALYGNFLGELISIDFPATVGAAILGSHPLILHIYTTYRLLEGIEHHSGFSLPYYLSFSHFIPAIMPGSAMHDFHHSHNSGCFGTSFYFWDWMMKTDGAYKAWQRANARIKFAKSN